MHMYICVCVYLHWYVISQEIYLLLYQTHSNPDKMQWLTVRLIRQVVNKTSEERLSDPILIATHSFLIFIGAASYLWTDSPPCPINAQLTWMLLKSWVIWHSAITCWNISLLLDMQSTWMQMATKRCSVAVTSQ